MILPWSSFVLDKFIRVELSASRLVLDKTFKTFVLKVLFNVWNQRQFAVKGDTKKPGLFYNFNGDSMHKQLWFIVQRTKLTEMEKKVTAKILP